LGIASPSAILHCPFKLSLFDSNIARITLGKSSCLPLSSTKSDLYWRCYNLCVRVGVLWESEVLPHNSLVGNMYYEGLTHYFFTLTKAENGQRFSFPHSSHRSCTWYIVGGRNLYYNYEILRMSTFETKTNARKVWWNMWIFSIICNNDRTHESSPYHLLFNWRVYNFSIDWLKAFWLSIHIYSLL
jgi:hypothetical protein